MRHSLIKYLLDAEATLPNGNKVVGPVTTNDDIEYHFVNKFSSLDFYIYLKKGDNGWYKSNGQDIEIPQSMIDDLGYQIDKFIIENPKLNNTKL